MGGRWDAAARDTEQRGENAVTAQAILYALGAATVVTGLVLVAVSAKMRPRRLATTPRTWTAPWAIAF